MKREGRITVLVADDQQLVREGLVTLLTVEADIEVVGQAPNGQEAVQLARELGPDVIMMDVRMPVLDGLQATSRIMREGHSRVLVLTTFDLDEYVFDALEAGASGFLLKDSSGEQLRAAVRVVAAGEAMLAPTITRRLISELTSRRARPLRASGVAPADLTPREEEVLRLVARGRSNREVAEELVLAEQTVKTYVGRLLAKLGLRDRTQIVVYAYENDLVGDP